MTELTEKAIRDAFPDAIIETATDMDGVLNIKIDPGAIVPVCETLRSLGFDYLADLFATDRQDRIEVVYRLTALERNEKLVLRIYLDRDKPEVDSVTSVWKGANFLEREAYDLLGVVFKGHPDLRRILLPEDWEGHPLRKDYVIPD
jgi:NADH-quinone oxidoreductase subunit C